ncbi:MAG: M1 family aminopeptidase [Flavobacteriales bacterium]
MVWVFLVLIALMVFGATASDNVVIGGTVGSVHKNAPHVIAMFTAILSLISLLIATAFFNNAALRDYQHQFNEILYSTPLSKSGYYFGRFFGALILACIPLIGVALGSIIGAKVAVGWLDADRIGPTPFEAIWKSFFIFVVPNMFFAGAILFAIANRWKSTVSSFAGALIILVGYGVSGTLLSDIDNETTGAMLDTFGIRTYSIESKYYTPIEKNTLSPGTGSLMLWNRLLWIGFGALVLVSSYLSFSFRIKSSKAKKKKETQKIVANIPAEMPIVLPAFNTATQWTQFASFFTTNFLSIVKSTTFRILLLFTGILYTVSLIDGFEYFGLKSYPITYKMVDSIEENSIIFIMIILVFFSGEVVWRDRMSHIQEVIDSSPHRSSGSLLAKLFSLVSVVLVLKLFMMLIGILYQLLMGFTFIELDVYIISLLLEIPSYLIWASVMIFLQVVINQRYLAYFTSILLLFFLDILWEILDIDTNMIDIGSTPSLPYSDMNGFGDGGWGTFWFTIYWTLFASILFYKAVLFWTRGYHGTFMDRLKNVKRSYRGKTALVLTSLVVAWLVCGSFIYYNTQVLNTYRTADERELVQANYEKNFKKYQRVPQPKIAAAEYHIDIYPYERRIDHRTVVTLINNNRVALDTLFFSTDPDWDLEIEIPGGTLVFTDEEGMFRKYALGTPLDTNAKLEIVYTGGYKTKGFENEVSFRSLVSNGTFINNWDLLPMIGYNERVELEDKYDRLKHGLAEKARMPKLQSACAEDCNVNYLSEGRADWVEVETFISTAGDQIAIAPGSLIKEWTENDRNYYHYKVDHPSQDFYTFISARYEVFRQKWNDINIEIYYDQKHAYNVETMAEAVEKSLKYYTENFGPYYHKQARIIEFPRYSSFAQAFPGTMPYSEALGYIADLRDEDDNNVVLAIIAHEMAHQWWAHQEIGAKMQGATMLSESFAEYSSLMVMKQEKDEWSMHNFLKYDHNRYLRGRSSETQHELPLYKVENQGHIHYGKGAVVLYGLQHYIGADSVNAALKSFLEAYRYQGPPYPTSLDFLAYLEPRVPDQYKHLIQDWFKEITLYDNRLTEATYTEKSDGKYDVVLEFESRKLRADTLGNEIEVPMNDWVEVAVFKDSEMKDVLYYDRIKMDEIKTAVTVSVDTIPAKAAVDPKQILIDRVFDDNFKTVNER